MNEPSLLAQYNAAGRRVAELEHKLQALRGENTLLRRRVELLEANAYDAEANA